MNSALSLIVWFFTILIVFFVFWWWFCHDAWKSFAIATLLSLLVLLIIFPWNLEHRFKDNDCHRSGDTAFFIIVAISIIILIAYIISTLFC